MSESLSWDATYAIALALKHAHAEVQLEDVSLRQIYEWTLALDDFADDPVLANDDILAMIYKEWFEELLNDIQ